MTFTIEFNKINRKTKAWAEQSSETIEADSRGEAISKFLHSVNLASERVQIVSVTELAS